MTEETSKQKNSSLGEQLQQNENDALYEHYRFVVDKGQAPMRIDKFLVMRTESISRNRIQNAILAGNITVNGNPVKASYKIKPNDLILILLPYPSEFEIVPENIPLDIVYEDNEILVINKPAGLVVHPGYGNYTGTLVNGLAYYFEHSNNSNNPELIRHGLVHRIDKDTSGLLVIAKTEKALNILAKQFFEKTVERTYWALIWGDLDQDEGTIIGNVGRSKRDRRVMAVYPEGSEDGKHAITHYKVLERFGYATLVKCNLETGRTHQIRVHFKHIGHPLFGDSTYGGDRILKGTQFPKFEQFVKNCFKIMSRQALHAKTLGFTHPTTKKFMQFDSNLPDDFAQVLEKWRKASAKYY